MSFLSLEIEVPAGVAGRRLGRHRLTEDGQQPGTRDDSDEPALLVGDGDRDGAGGAGREQLDDRRGLGHPGGRGGEYVLGRTQFLATVRPDTESGLRVGHDGAGGEHPGTVDILGEGGDVVVGRSDEDVLRGAHLHDLTVTHDRDLVAEAHGLVEVVGDEHDGLFEPFLELEQLILHVASDQRVERAEGLVHQQQIGVGGERAGETDALLHTAGELVRPGRLPAAQARHLQRLGSALLTLLTGHTLHFESVRGVLQNAAVREEREVLEDHADLGGAHVPQLLRTQRGQILAVEEHPSRRRFEQSVQHAKQRGLAGSGQAHDHEYLAGLDREGSVDHRCGRTIGAELVTVRAAFELPHSFNWSSTEDFVQVFGLQPGHIHLTR